MIRTSIAEPTPADPYAPDPAEIQGQAAVAAQEPSAEPNEHPSVLLDVLAAPFRGIESAVRNAYGLADFVVADALPNWEKNYTGESGTTPGKLVEGVAQFLTGFIPAVGVAGRVGQAVGAAGKVAKLGQAAAAGAITDFTVFGAQEERLSNLIQEYPSLANPITEFLAADQDDGEIEGRAKNALEGLGLGVLADGLLGSLRVVKTARKVKDGALPAAEAEKLISDHAPRVGKSLLEKKPEKAFNFSEGNIPELADVSKALAQIDLDNLGGGGLFQSPEKFVGRYLDSPKDVTDLLAKTSDEIMRTERQRASLGTVETVETMEARTKKVASVLGELSGSPAAEVLHTLRAQNVALAQATYVGDAAARLMVATANEASFYAKLVASGTPHVGLTMEQTMLHSLKAQELLTHLVTTVKQTGTIEGRALNARKFIKSAQIQAQAVASQMVEELGGSPYLTVELRKMAMAGNAADPLAAAKGVSDLVRQQGSLGSRLMRVHNEYWINSILSGPKTTVVNTLGNTMTTLYQPLEQAIGAAFQMDGKAVRASLKNYAFLAQSFSDSWRFALRAFKENEGILVRDGGTKELQSRKAITAENLLGENASTMAHFVNFVGETVRLPTRFLLGTDELFKQLNYRAAAQTELYYRGLDRGLQGKALSEYVADQMAGVISKGGERYSEASVIREAIQDAEAKGYSGRLKTDYIAQYVEKNFDATRSALADAFEASELAKGVADEATFTRPLGAMGKGVQAFAQSHPVFQLLIPFVRTPTNMVKYFAERGLGAIALMPGIGRIQGRNVAELASENALVRSRAMGRIATGQMLVSTAALAALNGKLTGKGPTEKSEMENLKATGWQPYSIVIESNGKKEYVSFQRIDPFATFFGLIADWAETAKRQDPFTADTLQAVLTALATSVSNNVTNKTYLASLSQAIDAINQPDRKAATWARSRLGSYVPSAIAQWNSTMDDGQNMREIRGFFDGAINRIPGAQGMLEVKRNILGEPVDSVLAQTPLSAVNPFTMSKDKGDPVFAEIAKFNHGIQPPSPVVFNKVNLLEHKTTAGGTAYDRWLQLTGAVTIGGKTLREQLSRLIASNAYTKLPLTEPQDGYDTPRLGAVRGVIESYRKAALAQVQKEVPSVAQAVKDYQLGQAAVRRGNLAQARAQTLAVIESAQ